MPGPEKRAEHPEDAARAVAESARRDESHLEQQTQARLEGAQRRMPEEASELRDRHAQLGNELEADHEAVGASPAQRRDERALFAQFQQAQEDQLADAQRLELRVREQQAAAVSEVAPGPAREALAAELRDQDRALDELRNAIAGRMEQDEGAMLEAAYAPQPADARLQAMRDVLETQAAERAQLQAAGRALAPAVSQDAVQREAAERALREEYQRLSDTIASYDQLKQRTGKWNADARELYGLDKNSLEYAGLRLDAEHFIDKRFFEPFKQELEKLGIRSQGEMPAFAVHTEYHLRSPQSLAKDAGFAADKTLHGTTLTQEKQDAIPHDQARERYPKLQDLLKAFEEFWKQKASVAVGGTTHELGASYWDRLAPTFKELRDEARKQDL